MKPKVGPKLSPVGGCPEIKVAQNDLKHILVLEFLKSDEVFKKLQVATSK